VDHTEAAPGAPDTPTNVTTAVAWPLTGFFAPVDNRPFINGAKAGSAIPVKFSVGGYRGMDIFAADYPKSQAIVCSTGPWPI
jgi:hypothetical protein